LQRLLLLPAPKSVYGGGGIKKSPVRWEPSPVRWEGRIELPTPTQPESESSTPDEAPVKSVSEEKD